MAATYKTAAIEKMLGTDPSGRLKRLYSSLTTLGLKTRLPPNSETLLFEIITPKKERIGLAAIRAGYTEVLSFPKTYWTGHAPELRAAVAAIEGFHHIDTEGFVSSSQYSLKQIRISQDTIERLDEVVKNLVASHARKLAGTVPRLNG